MSTFKMVYNDNYNNTEIKKNSIEYILNPFRAISGYVGGVGVSPECPAESMQLVSEILVLSSIFRKFVSEKMK